MCVPGGASSVLADVAPWAVLQVLRYMYLDVPPEVDESDALKMLRAAMFFQMPRLLAICETQVQAMVDDGNVCEVLEEADAARATQLKRFCVHYIVEHLDAVGQTPGFEQLPRALLVEVLHTVTKQFNETVRMATAPPDASTGGAGDAEATAAMTFVEEAPADEDDDDDAMAEDAAAAASARPAP